MATCHYRRRYKVEVITVSEKVKEARELAKKRNFTQTFDLIINLQNMDLKKPEHKVDVGITLDTKVKEKGLKICAIIDHSISDAEKVFDKVLYPEELNNLKGNMPEIRKLSHDYDKFVVIANYMPVFAQILGRYLGPMNKMPSPKLGMVINPKTPLQPLYDKLQKTAHLQTKKNLVLQVSVGSEKDTDEVIAKNIVHVYDSLLHVLPAQKNNLKDVSVKLTMGKLVVL
jgi:large subunit ribosomal protein L1